MIMISLSFGFSFQDLHTPEGLARLDQVFLRYLEDGDESLALRLKKARLALPSSLEESILLLDLSPYVEDFMGKLFGIEQEVSDLQTQAHALAPLYRCKRLFIQRQAAKAYSQEEAQSFNGPQLKEDLKAFLGGTYLDLGFAQCVLHALENVEENKPFLELAKKYAAWALHQESPSLLFRLPRKMDPEALIPLKRDGNVLRATQSINRDGFDCTNSGITPEEALDQAHYCILCHPQDKDSCSKGLSETAKGCPLDQKISEMNTLRTQGYTLGALAMIMVDNPIVAATGHRICNDCMKGCIFQKQEAVDIPSIESQTLDSILNLPWGVEIYGLLSRWNPLNLKRPYPCGPSGYKVLVAGMGPAGFTLAHYLINEGHTVVGIDELKIELLEEELLTQPICNWGSLKEPLSQRTPVGFGGVAEYGITARWDKNYLKLVRLLLERRSNFTLNDEVRLGEDLSLSQAFDLGFDHVALCLGAGQPKVLGLPQESAKGVWSAATFLRELQLSGATQKNAFTTLQIRLPIIVIGGGLTAVDAATEALAYYPVQVEKFLKRTEEQGIPSPSLSAEDAEIEQAFLNHAHALREGNRSFLEKASTIVYRKRCQESPSYRLNAHELEMALKEGVHFLENAMPKEIKVDRYGSIESLVVDTPEGLQTLPCRTLLVATGTHPNTALERAESELKICGEEILLVYNGTEKVSFFGDLHPTYQGNVVKAMASVKKGYPKICEALLKRPPLCAA